MEIVIGSLNKAKVSAVATHYGQATIITESVPSNVSPQPVGDEETLRGAMNRAENAQSRHPHMVGIGLEGGVMHLENTMYLINWGALVTPEGAQFTAAGARIPLPESFNLPIKEGKELGDIMNDFVKRTGIRDHEGAIGIFTNDVVDRATMFMHVVALLKGQKNYWDKK